MNLEEIKTQWQEAPPWQKLLVAIILPAVVGGALWFYYIAPLIDKKIELQNKKEQLQSEIESLRLMARESIITQLTEQLNKLLEEEKLKRKELEEVVGDIPKADEVERVLSRINSISIRHNVVIGSISMSAPKVKRYEMVDTGEGKVIRPVAEPQAQQNQAGNQSGGNVVRGRVSSGRQVSNQGAAAQMKGVPIKVVEVNLKLIGSTKDIYGVLRSIHKRGIASYPRVISIKPMPEKNAVDAVISLDIILQN